MMGGVEWQTFSDLEKTVDKAQFSLLKAEIDIRKGMWFVCVCVSFDADVVKE